MNFICGSNALGSTLNTSEGLTGTVVFTAPFVISGYGEYINSLALCDRTVIPALLSESGSLIMSAGFAEFITDTVTLTAPLSAMDDDTVSLNMPALTGNDASLVIYTELTERSASQLTIINTLGDYAYSGDLSVSNPLDISGLTGCFNIALPQSTGMITDDSLSVYGNGADITKYLLNAEIDLFQMTLRAEFQPAVSISELLLNINKEEYSFEVTGGSRTAETSILFGNLKIDTNKRTLDHKVIKGSELAAQFTDVIWSAPDIVLTDITGSYTGKEIAELIANNTGYYSRLLPDGRSLIFDYSKANPVHTPEHIVEWQVRSAELADTFTKVVYGRSGDTHITIEPEERTAQAGGNINIRIYGSSPQIETDGNLIKISTDNTETVREKIIFENGFGRISKPAFQIMTEGVSAYGKNVLTNSSVVSKDVVYKTKYDTYQIASAEAGTYAVMAYINNSALFLRGGTSIKTKIEAPHLTDHVSAFRLAEKKYRKDGAKLELTTTHDNIINTTSGLNLSTAYGSGAVTGAKRHIQGNPVKITDKLEVLQWQK